MYYLFGVDEYLTYVLHFICTYSQFFILLHSEKNIFLWITKIWR